MVKSVLGNTINLTRKNEEPGYGLNTMTLNRNPYLRKSIIKRDLSVGFAGFTIKMEKLGSDGIIIQI